MRRPADGGWGVALVGVSLGAVPWPGLGLVPAVPTAAGAHAAGWSSGRRGRER